VNYNVLGSINNTLSFILDLNYQNKRISYIIVLFGLNPPRTPKIDFEIDVKDQGNRGHLSHPISVFSRLFDFRETYPNKLLKEQKSKHCLNTPLFPFSPQIVVNDLLFPDSECLPPTLLAFDLL
jgi:hypothetical protein